jgi:DNA-binding CsgD family transcriptional regulator
MVEGYSLSEIATELGISRRSLTTLVGEARAELEIQSRQ